MSNHPHRSTNLFSQFNAAKPTQVGVLRYPWLAGWRGAIYWENGRAWALVEHASAAGYIKQTLGVVPFRFADKADAIEFDPYNDAAYAQSMLDLATNALASAEQHQQTGQKKVRSGGLDLNS